LDIGGMDKLWEWCVNRAAGVFPYLLRKSSGLGGGDIIEVDNPQYAGRWAGDEIYLVGDYDDSNLYETAQSEYHNIAGELAKEFNTFVEVDDFKLRTE
jgi:hypothetical protein